MGIVKGDRESAIPFQVCKDTVYVRLNIKPLPQENDDNDEIAMYEWQEIQMGLHELLEIVSKIIIDVDSITPKLEIRELNSAEFSSKLFNFNTNLQLTQS